MSKPADISQSAWDAAKPAAEVANECCYRMDGYEVDVRVAIARAIMVETEACAVIADCDCDAGICEHREKADLIRVRLKP